MDSDSDSDGSHISTTPPRDPPLPSPPPPPVLPPSRLTSLSTTKIRPKSKNAAAATVSSRPILRPNLSRTATKPPQIHTRVESQQASVISDPICPPPVLSDLPFQINRTRKNSLLSNETLPPGGLCVSKFASFSKIRKDILNFEPIESDPVPQSDEKFDSCSVVSEETQNETSNSEKVTKKRHLQNETSNSENVIKKRLNLIGSASFSSSSFPAKKVKCVNEGNFVKLNINGHGRKKFTFKGKKNRYGGASNGNKRFSYQRRKKTKVGGESEEEEKRSYEAEAVAVEIKQRKKVPGFDAGLLEEAIMRVGAEASDENLVELLKLTHGYDSFRDGQLEAIKMVLSGKSTMLVLPTGAGKSLCYQLPSLVLPGVTIVVSPLVALMIDQLKQLPSAIPGGLLSSSQTPEEASATLRLLQDGAIKVLLVSPERFLNAEFTSFFSSSLVVSLVVIDEAHCVSEWSHNFRPSYTRLRASMLRDKLHAECIFAMTATATSKTLFDVMHSLEIPKTNLIHVANMRDNLQLSVSMTSNRMKDLLALLMSSPYKEAKSIIIYCKFQSEADFLSKYLCDNYIKAKSYHSAIPAKERSRIQELFCCNKTRVVVATVAFGMGLDKRDVRAVIHYSLPESLEEYVQEIGRAGRDGTLSHCHLFVDDATYFKMRSLIHSDGVDEYAVKKLLCQLFNGSPSGNLCSIIKESASRKFDIKEEVMLTILTHLELGQVQYLKLLPQMNVTCTVNFHQTTPTLLANKDMVIASILKNSELKDGQYVFDIPRVANRLAVQSSNLSNHLYSLKVKGEISYELKDQAFCYRIINVPNDICSLAADVANWLSDVEISKVRKIDVMYNAAVFAAKECDKLNGCDDCQHTFCLQKTIMEYFNKDEGDDIIAPSKIAKSSPFLRADIKVFLQSNTHAKFTPRAIARIMHGLASPAFPSAIWSQTHFWGRYMHINFKQVMEAAKAELLSSIVHTQPN